MQNLKNLVDKVRQQTKSQSELSEGGGREVYNFDNNLFPNASEYDEQNKKVGRNLPSEKQDTVSFVGENFVENNVNLNGLQNALADTLDTVNPIIRAFIEDDKFILTQTKLRAINRVSGKVFNPLGILASYLDDGTDGDFQDSALAGVLAQTISNITGGGAFKTTDGETYYGAVDIDAQSDRFSLDGFKDSVKGQGLTPNAFIREILSTAGEAVGLEFPTRSIVAQVLAYNNSLFSDVNGASSGWLGQLDSDNTTYEDKINPIGVDAINYLYDSELIVKDPEKYYELSQKINRGLMAGNVMVKKPDDLIEEEERTLLKYGGNAVLDRLFGTDIQAVKSFYINKKKSFSPDEENITDSLISYFLPEFDDNLSSGFKISNFIYSVAEKLPDGNIKDIEELERLEKLSSYGNNVEDVENPSDSSKIKSLRETSDFQDETNHPEQYQYHNIEVKLGDSFRQRLKDKSFSNLKNISDDYPQNDVVNYSDIYGADEDREFDTNHFMAIEDVGNNKVIYLRPTFENISEDIQVNNGDFFYIGRTEPFPNYENTTRSVTLSFKMYADTPNEFLMMWKKMNFLNSLAYPTGTPEDNFKAVKNPLIRFTVGDLFKRVGGYLNTLNYVYSNNDATWETEKNKMAPKIIDVSMSFTVLHDEMPYVHKNNNFEFGGANDFNSYSVDYSDLDE